MALALCAEPSRRRRDGDKDRDGAGRPHAGATAAAASGPRGYFVTWEGRFPDGTPLRRPFGGPGRSALCAVAVVAAWGQAFPCAPDRVGASVVTGVQGLGRRGPLQAADAAEGRRGAFSVPASSHPPGAAARLSPPPGCTAENAGWRKGAPQTGPGSRRGEQSGTGPQRPQRLPRRSGARGPRGACVVAVSSPTLGAGVPRCPPRPPSSPGDPNAGPAASLASRLRWGQVAQKGAAGPRRPPRSCQRPGRAPPSPRLSLLGEAAPQAGS